MKNGVQIVATIAGLFLVLSNVACYSQVTPVHEVESWPVDPMVQLRDKSHDFYTDATPVLHQRGTGTKTFTIKSVPTDTTQITYYISCTPSSHYRITMGKGFNGPCSRIVQNSGGIPLLKVSELKVQVNIPAKTNFYIVGIPENK